MKPFQETHPEVKRPSFRSHRMKSIFQPPVPHNTGCHGQHLGDGELEVLGVESEQCKLVLTAPFPILIEPDLKFF